MIKAVKGTRDILPPASALWNRVEATAREVFTRFRYAEIRTPIFEETALFARGVGEETDIVSKEMYTFDDHGTPLTLRPENTASVIRSYIENRLDQQPGLQKLYYIGPMFRRERPQKGRFRQFHQIGAEAIGSEHPDVDGDVIAMICALFDAVGLTGYTLEINSIGTPESRRLYVEQIRRDLEPHVASLSEDSQRRLGTNPLRILDSKDPQDQPFIDALPSLDQFLSDDDRTHFDRVKRILDAFGIPYRVNPRLVRGLDYYTRTTFEFKHGQLGAQNAICGGGRYDGLAEQLGSKVKAPGIGFSIGFDRLILALEENGHQGSAPPLDVYIWTYEWDAYYELLPLVQQFRQAGLAVELSSDWRIKRTFELANKGNARFTLLYGSDERAQGIYQLKDMSTGEQQPVTREQLLSRIQGS